MSSGTKTRMSLAKAIRAEWHITKKISAAHNCGMFLPLQLVPRTKRDRVGYVERVRRTSADDQNFTRDCLNLGRAILRAVQDGNYKFFADVADILQYRRGPELEGWAKTYNDILEFCEKHECGWRGELPCDGMKLAAFLRARGHDFPSDHDNQVPRTLRQTCARIGITLAKKERSRRKHR